MPKVQMATVDVRDVAQAHLNAILFPAAANKRFMLVSESVWFKDFGAALDEVYGKGGSNKYKVVSNELPKLLCQMVSFVDKEIAVLMPLWNVKKSFSNIETQDILKIDFIPMKKSV